MLSEFHCGAVMVMWHWVMLSALSYPPQFGHFYDMLVIIEAWTE